MAESSSVQASEPTGDYVLLHRDTGTALYATRASEDEIHRANLNLRRSGNRNRYVAARHFGHGGRMGIPAILQGNRRRCPCSKHH